MSGPIKFSSLPTILSNDNFNQLNQKAVGTGYKTIVWGAIAVVLTCTLGVLLISLILARITASESFDLGDILMITFFSIVIIGGWIKVGVLHRKHKKNQRSLTLDQQVIRVYDPEVVRFNRAIAKMLSWDKLDNENLVLVHAQYKLYEGWRNILLSARQDYDQGKYDRVLAKVKLCQTVIPKI